MFTSIPINFALECVQEFLEVNKDIYDRTRLNSDEIYNLVKLCLNSSLFRFNQNFFKQIKGTPMGSPASVVIAEIVMQKIETLIMQKISPI